MMSQGARAVASRALALPLTRQASTTATNSRRMIYPYTWTAKVAQFPWKFHYDNVWLFRYFPPAYAFTLYVYWKIQQKSCSPENYKAYHARMEKEAAEHAEKHH